MMISKTRFCLFLAVLCLIFGTNSLNAQSENTQVKAPIDTVKKEKHIVNQAKKLLMYQHNGTILTYDWLGNYGSGFGSMMPTNAQLFRISSGVSLFKIPLQINGQYSIGDRYSTNYLSVQIDQSRFNRLSQFKLSPEQVFQNTRDSIQNWNKYTLKNLSGIEGELTKYKNLPEFDTLLRYDEISKVFADSFEYLDTSRVKSLFQERNKLKGYRDKYNAYKALTKKRQELFDLYNRNADSLKKLDQVLDSGEFKPPTERFELQKLNLGQIQANTGLQTNYARPLKGINVAGQYGIWYGEITAGMSGNQGIQNTKEPFDLFVQSIAGIKQENYGILLFASRLSAREERKLNSRIQEETNSLGLNFFKRIKGWKFSGDISSGRYRNSSLKDAFFVSENADTAVILTSNSSFTNSLNYQFSSEYRGKITNASLIYSHQGTGWSYGSLVYPNENISRITGKGGMQLLNNKVSLQGNASTVFFSKEKNATSRTFQLGATIRWAMNPFNNLVVGGQYIESGKKTSPVRQGIGNLTYTNVMQLGKTPVISTLNYMYHELNGGLINQRNSNIIGNVQVRLKEFLMFNILVQRFETKATGIQRKSSMVQAGISGAVKEYNYALQVGESRTLQSQSLISSLVLGYANKKFPLSGEISMNYNQLFNLVGNGNDYFRGNTSYNMITRFSLKYRI